jgi:elongation factor Ts
MGYEVKKPTTADFPDDVQICFAGSSLAFSYFHCPLRQRDCCTNTFTTYNLQGYQLFLKMIISSASKFMVSSFVGRCATFTIPGMKRHQPFLVSTHYSGLFAEAKRGMADFSMAQLKKLRAISGAPIIECKKALTEVSGNVDDAMDWLRKHGAAKAAQKTSGRDAEEGLVACVVSQDEKSASLVKISSETDFAGKSPAFVQFVTHVAESTLGSSDAGSLDSEAVLNLESNSKTVQFALEEAIVAIRENLGISSALKVTTDDGMFVSYVHGRVDNVSPAGSAAAVVELAGKADAESMQEAGKKLAMHIVAAKPSYLTPESVPTDIVEREKEVLQSQVCSLLVFSANLLGKKTLF